MREWLIVLEYSDFRLFRWAQYPVWVGRWSRRATGDKDTKDQGREFSAQPPHSNGTPGICFAVRIVKLVFTLATFGAGVSLLVRNS